MVLRGDDGMKRTVLAGAVAACLGMAVFAVTTPDARAESAPIPVPTSKATAHSRLANRPSSGITWSPRHHGIVPPEIHGGTIYLPDISAGPIILPTIKGGTITLPDIKGGTITLPDISGRPIMLPKIEGGAVSIPPIVFPSLHARGSIQVNGTLPGWANGRGNFLAAGGMGAPAGRPMSLPQTGA